MHRVNLVLLRGTPGRGRFVARRTAADPVAGSPCRDCKMGPERGLWLEQRWERRPWVLVNLVRRRRPGRRRRSVGEARGWSGDYRRPGAASEGWVVWSEWSGFFRVDMIGIGS